MRHVFIDESSQNAHHFLVLGALVVPGAHVTQIEERLETLLIEHRTLGELKWTKVSNGKLHVYQDFLNAYFGFMVDQGCRFHALIVDCHALDHAGYNLGDSELGINKFLYELLFHKVGKVFGDSERVVVDLDSKNTTRAPTELQGFLNLRMKKFMGDVHPAFARVAFRDSKSTRLLQIADLLAGSVAWHKNDHDAAPGASKAKAQLARHVAQLVGLQRLGNSSRRGECRLDIWNFRLGQRRG